MAKNKPVSNLPVTANDYTVMQVDTREIAEALSENLGGRPIGPRDLEQITVPAGGGIAWTVQTLDGPDSVKVIEGVIVARKDQRSYWRDDFEGGGGSPPDCYSLDLEIGIGDPGGSCADCPFAKFGSARGGEGSGQACAQTMLLMTITKDELLPKVVVVPPSSLKAMRQYFMRLTSSALPYHAVITRFGLKQTKSGGGITYSEIVPEMGGRLTPEERAKLVPLREMLNGAKLGPINDGVDPQTGEVRHAA
jgi:hypothetical protein